MPLRPAHPGVGVRKVYGVSFYLPRLSVDGMHVARIVPGRRVLFFQR